MKRIVISFLVTILASSSLHAAQSTITEAEGYACMGYDKSRKLTEDEALANAKRIAVEYASTYIKSETKVKDAILEKDLIEAYANASVKLIEEMARAWYKDSASGDCVKIKIKAEVIPDDRAMELVVALDVEWRLGLLLVRAPTLSELPIAPLRSVDDLVRLEIALRRFSEIHRSKRSKVLIRRFGGPSTRRALV